MSARQLIVLVVAAIAALGALLLIRGMGATHVQPVAQSTPVAGEQVLVVTANVAQGAALKPSDLSWRVFPEASITDQFIRSSRQANATTELVGAVTRRAFVPGEPVILASVVMPDGHGFMAAELRPGFRAVAIKIKPETAAGGYVQPNDRVDVILTTETQRSDSGGSSRDVHSEIVLEDVRVLALDDTVQTQTTGDAPARVAADVAVLELSTEDARVLAQAEAIGDLSLSLRGVEADTADAPSASGRRRSLSNHQGTILVHSFGTVSSGGGR